MLWAEFLRLLFSKIILSFSALLRQSSHPDYDYYEEASYVMEWLRNRIVSLCGRWIFWFTIAFASYGLHKEGININRIRQRWRRAVKNLYWNVWGFKDKVLHYPMFHLLPEIVVD